MNSKITSNINQKDLEHAFYLVYGSFWAATATIMWLHAQVLPFSFVYSQTIIPEFRRQVLKTMTVSISGLTKRRFKQTILAFSVGETSTLAS